MEGVNTNMNWKDYIHSDPEILAGKPIIKGTRLSVVFILELFAKGWSEEEILENYPSLTPEHINAIYSFTANYINEDNKKLSHKIVQKMLADSKTTWADDISTEREERM